MSELKAYYCTTICDEHTEFYLKSEADQVIANITKGAISMFKESSCCRGFDLKSSLGNIADAAFKHWCYVESIQQKCINFERDKESSRQLRRQLMDRVERLQNRILQQAMELRHQKYKRCLAMAKWCDTKADWYYGIGRSFRDRVEFYIKWHKRWLELAEVFK